MISKRITRHIDRLLLDPNNYRFIDSANYKFTPDLEADDLRVQQRTLNLITGKNEQNIQDLISSFKSNGFLDIEQIQVKAIGDKYYLVLEGNRRTATLKYLWEEYKKGNDVGKLTESDFKSISLVEIIDEDPVEHLITMGLHHISGKKRWNAVNEAQLVDDLINKYQLSEEDICDKLGISKHKLRRLIRTLSLVEQYKLSDFGDQFESNMFTLFETVVGNSKMKRWLGWDDNNYVAKNNENSEKLFSWISEVEEVEEDEDGNERVHTIEPIVTQYRQIKEIAEFIDDPIAINKMEESRSITEGYTYSDAIGENRLKNALENINSEIQVAFNFSNYLTDNEYQNIEDLKIKLDRLIPSTKIIKVAGNKLSDLYFPTIRKHFYSIFIHKYRRLTKISINKLAQVNIFVGGNNMGKTSILEAVFLSSQLNNLSAFLLIEKYRNKDENDNRLNPNWINQSFTEDIEIESVFNNFQSGINISIDQTEDDIDKAGYISTIFSEAKIKDDILESNLHLYNNKDADLRFTKSATLCQATFTSPYKSNSSLLKKAHAFAVERKYFDEIISFIRENLDEHIEKVDLINIDNETRFVVTSSSLHDAIEITKYGEGLQRVFEIALLMVYSQNGIICIDEIDSAIHKKLLINFTSFIQELANKFNVQVFLTTHSKECIDAFVKNDFPDDELMAYALEYNKENKLVCNYLEGNKLKQLVESIDIDIR